MIDTAAGLSGPTIGSLADAERPQPMPACGTCPKAMWYRTAKHLRAFCREIRHLTWEDGDSDPILQCDGREAALTLVEELVK